MWPRVARGAAFGLAAIGVVDPALTSMRPSRPVVAIVAAASSDASAGRAADRVAARLEAEYRVVRGPFAGAAAVVAVGEVVPDIETRDGVVALAVTPDRPGPRVKIEDLRAPARASFDSRVPVAARVHAAAAAGRRVDVTLSSDGLVVDRVSRQLTSADERFDAAFTVAPIREGLAGLRVTARIAGESGPDAMAAADEGIYVERRRWAVLFVDRRPSWMSTFVRRALEGDQRFAVTARISTSKDVTTDIGLPPASLTNLSTMAAFDAVVVGAPDALTASDAASLEVFARARGGAVVWLMDQRGAGPSDRLTSLGPWSNDTQAAAVDIDAVGAGDGRLQASEMAWPDRLPAGAEALATASPGGHPVVWRMSIGSGRLVVSGALDAWRFRAAKGSSFDQFWRTLIGNAADQSPPSIGLELASSIVKAGAPGRFTATLRDWTGGQRTPLDASMDGPDGRVDIPLWRETTPGQVSGSIPAGMRGGAYRLRVTSGVVTAEAPFIVAEDVQRVQRDESSLLTAWASARRGNVVPESRMSDVVDLLRQRIPADNRRQTWHPMRSPWWIAAMAFLLGSEWWWRRRRGWR